MFLSRLSTILPFGPLADLLHHGLPSYDGELIASLLDNPALVAACALKNTLSIFRSDYVGSRAAIDLAATDLAEVTHIIS